MIRKRRRRPLWVQTNKRSRGLAAQAQFYFRPHVTASCSAPCMNLRFAGSSDSKLNADLQVRIPSLAGSWNSLPIYLSPAILSGGGSRAHQLNRIPGKARRHDLAKACLLLTREPRFFDRDLRARSAHALGPGSMGSLCRSYRSNPLVGAASRPSCHAGCERAHLGRRFSVPIGQRLPPGPGQPLPGHPDVLVCRHDFANSIHYGAGRACRCTRT